MIARRLFLGGLLTAAVGPAIVRASSLMRVVVPKPVPVPVPEIVTFPIDWFPVRATAAELRAMAIPIMNRYMDNMMLEHMMGGKLIGSTLFEVPIILRDGDTLSIDWSARV